MHEGVEREYLVAVEALCAIHASQFTIADIEL